MLISDPAVVDAIWLGIAFLSGLLAQRVGLPALVGYLFTGFVLNLTGILEGRISDVLQTVSDVGILLLLFTIGLKIRPKNLYDRNVWVPATLHVLGMVFFTAILLYLFSFSGWSLFHAMRGSSLWLFAFALSFSSTVFAAKVLEQRSEMGSLHGKTAIGILIFQDLFAVVFLFLLSDDQINLWAIGIPLYLFVARWLLSRLLNESGHGELLTIFGFFAALVGGALIFKLAGIKPDIGALVAGMLLASHPKSGELYDRMMSYKDFFLIAFFVGIGMTGIPGATSWIIALLLLPLLFVKGFLFLRLLGVSGLQIRSAFLTTIALTNFSEFGLIVVMAGVQMGLLSQEWVMILALLMTLSFMLTAPLNARAHLLFDRYKRWIIVNMRKRAVIDKEPVTLGSAEYLIVGMGSFGRPAYDHFALRAPGSVMGVDYKQEQVDLLRSQGLHVVWGDAASSMFWTYKRLSDVKLVLLAMSDFSSNKNAFLEVVKMKRRKFKVGVITHYPEEDLYFRERGADFIYNYKSHIGSDFAEKAGDVIIEKKEIPL